MMRDYRGSLGQPYAVEATGDFSYASIRVLPELTGHAWDEATLGLVHGLRPSAVRVTDGEIKLNSKLWRVTVYVHPVTDLIEYVEQEVEVWLASGIEDGQALMDIFRD